VTLCAMAKGSASVYLASVIRYDHGRAYGRRSIDKDVLIGAATTLSAIVRRLKTIGALRSDAKTVNLRLDDRYYPRSLSIVRKRDGVELVELELWTE